jgi:hypothetical protein
MDLLNINFNDIKNNSYEKKEKEYINLITKVHNYTNICSSIKEACKSAGIKYRQYYTARDFFMKGGSINKKNQNGGNNKIFKNYSEQDLVKNKKNDIPSIFEHMRDGKRGGSRDIVKELCDKKTIKVNKKIDENDLEKMYGTTKFLNKLDEARIKAEK